MGKPTKDESTPNVVFLFGKNRKPPPATPLNVDHLFAVEEEPASRGAAVDLTKKPKAVFLIGGGGMGKTTFARWVGERAKVKGSDPPMYLVTVDPIKRDLLQYHPDAMQPEVSNVEEVTEFLRQVLDQQMKMKRSVTIDCGGGDLAFLELIKQMPDLHVLLQDAGVEPVAMHFLSPEQTSLTMLVATERAGFRPQATALVLNRGKAELTRNTGDQFVRVREHQEYVKAIERGAVEVWLPRLHAAAVIQDLRVGYWASIDAMAEVKLSMFEHSQVRQWLAHMEQNMQTIESWVTP